MLTVTLQAWTAVSIACDVLMAATSFYFDAAGNMLCRLVTVWVRRNANAQHL